MMTNGILTTKKRLDVAVAVLVYGERLLLARRLAHQHQGGKLEFVGGKIEPNEAPTSALVREVAEELGLDISKNLAIKMGRIRHDYPEKSVCLHIYHVSLNDEQYDEFKDRTVGLDGQEIGFYDKSWVQTQADSFPQANRQILRWLSLPSVIVVSRPLAEFDDGADWVAYHADALPKDATLSVRVQTDGVAAWQLVQDLHSQRPDISFIMPWQIRPHQPSSLNAGILAYRLTHEELVAFDVDRLCVEQSFDVPIMASCHDALSLNKANECAKTHNVLGVFVSPVKPTLTHAGSPSLGWQKFGRLADVSDVPVVALGGLSLQDELMAGEHGAMAISGIRKFLLM